MRQLIKLSTSLILLFILGIILPSFVNAETIDVQVSAGTDDVGRQLTSSAWPTASTYIVIGYSSEGSRVNVGIRFLNASIPSGAIITSSYLSFQGNGGGSPPVAFDIFGEKISTPGTFGTEADFLARPHTTAR